MLVPGENEVEASPDFWTPVNYFFVPTQSGEYEISVSGATFSFDYYNEQYMMNEQWYFYGSGSTVISMKAGTVYPFYSTGAAGTVTITPIDVAYDSYTGTGAASDSPIILGGAGSGIGAYEITIGSNTTLYFSYGATSELTVSASSTAVSATYNGTVYAADGETPFSFTSAAPLGIGSVTFSVTNNTNETVTIVLYVSQVYTLTAPGEGGDEPTGTALQEGNNTVTTTADGGETAYYFTAEVAGTYTFSSTDTNLLLNADGGNYMLIPAEGMGSFTVELAAGESITMVVMDYNWGTTAGNCTVTIARA